MTEPFHYDGVKEAPVDATDIVIPPTLTKIGDYAFYRCYSITTIELPPSITTIEEYAFSFCTSLSSIIIPDSVTTIGEGAFERCTSLKTITLPKSVTTIGERAFNSCLSLTTIILPPKVTILEGYMFHGCSSLSTVELPPKVTSIKDYTFRHCTSLSTIALPATLTLIKYNAFFNCSKLKSIQVHPSLPMIVIHNEDRIDRYAVINNEVGEISNVFKRNSFTESLMFTKCQFLGMEKYYAELCDYDNDVLVNWRIYSQRKNQHGRLPLFSALEQSLRWSDGLCSILNGYGAAIEERDVITGLEAFMLAAVGPNSAIETIFYLLQDHPAAIHPYVIMTQ